MRSLLYRQISEKDALNMNGAGEKIRPHFLCIMHLEKKQSICYNGFTFSLTAEVLIVTYKIDFDHWGRFFNVPCNLVDEHLKLADGDYVKVLLCLLAGSSNTADSEQLALLSGVSERKVNDAVHYWADSGVISVEGIQKSERPAVAASAEVAQVIKKPLPVKEKPVRTTLRYSPKELANRINENEELRFVITEYEKIKGTVIKDNEIMGFINLIEYYGFDAQSLILMIEYCSKLGKSSMAYLEKMAKDWFDRDIVSYPEVEAEIIRQSMLKSYEYKAAKAIGLEGKPSANQSEKIRLWNERGISIEMLNIAYDKCMDAISKPSFSYIAKIIDNWFNEGVTTVEAVRKKDDQRSRPSGNERRNDNSQTSYDLDEWEKYALSFDPENGGNGNGVQ